MMIKAPAAAAFALLYLACASLSAEAASPTGRYFIRLKPSTNLRRFDPQFKQSLAEHASAAPDENQLVYQYTKAVPGYAGKFSPEFLQELEANPDVAEIIEDVVGELDALQADGPVWDPSREDLTFSWDMRPMEEPVAKGWLGMKMPPSWGQRRISTRPYNRDAELIYPESRGEGIIVYVLDSGIEHEHPAFEGRASFLGNFVEGEPDEDVLGHGTHIAGTITGKFFGIAQKATVVGLKVCNSNAKCAASDVVAGIQAILRRHSTAPFNSTRAIINMSLGVPAHAVLDENIEAAAKQFKIPVIVSSGNSKENGCYKSPRRSPHAFVVAASDEGDRHAEFTNYGPCIRLYAPGVDIVSAVPGMDDFGMLGRYQPRSGSSMATPHVTGTAVLFMAQNQYPSVEALYQHLESRGTPDAITEVRGNTTKRLVYALVDDRWQQQPPVGEAAIKPGRIELPPPPPPTVIFDPTLGQNPFPDDPTFGSGGSTIVIGPPTRVVIDPEPPVKPPPPNQPRFGRDAEKPKTDTVQPVKKPDVSVSTPKPSAGAASNNGPWHQDKSGRWVRGNP